jgi:hypothetical protein
MKKLKAFRYGLHIIQIITWIVFGVLMITVGYDFHTWQWWLGYVCIFASNLFGMIEGVLL